MARPCASRPRGSPEAGELPDERALTRCSPPLPRRVLRALAGWCPPPEIKGATNVGLA